ncbi:XRE family transcriptional regulator [Pontibacter diazotrophicus]|uniref:XRE family transcriptional regulator n=1 Tax=Pontibacter diazotrophicus TaxID=1400979 RepID=A0A3D8L9J7_9BACT|nr:helix-turn-helix transcriptional regulator [Pontibacter diazotrophicus]RDV14024.1 XRE family transcriptional regulator [Pontibacter diazotrophicus]
MVDRIRQLMEYKEFTSTQLADNIEVPRAVVSHILSGRNKPSLDVMLKIISCYREISVNWLLLGEGDMLKGLASESKPEKAVASPEDEQPKASAETPNPSPPPEKVQEPSPVVRAPLADGRAIEQVMVFYTDKTFTSYKPGV